MALGHRGVGLLLRHGGARPGACLTGPSIVSDDSRGQQYARLLVNDGAATCRVTARAQANRKHISALRYDGYPNSRAKRLRLKRYLDEMKGTVLANIWSDIRPINYQAKERLA